MKSNWPSGNVQSSSFLQCKRILIPVDLEKVKCSLDAIQFVEGMAGDLSIQPTLLYVIPLNTAPTDRRIDRELSAEYEKKLRELARVCLPQSPSLSYRLRHGRPHEEIAAEAEADQSDLIILSPPKLSPWPLMFRSRTAERVAREAPCFTLVLPRSVTITPEQYRQVMRGQNGISDRAPDGLAHLPNSGRFVYQ